MSLLFSIYSCSSPHAHRYIISLVCAYSCSWPQPHIHTHDYMFLPMNIHACSQQYIHSYSRQHITTRSQIFLMAPQIPAKGHIYMIMATYSYPRWHIPISLHISLLTGRYSCLQPYIRLCLAGLFPGGSPCHLPQGQTKFGTHPMQRIPRQKSWCMWIRPHGDILRFRLISAYDIILDDGTITWDTNIIMCRLLGPIGSSSTGKWQ